MRTLLAIACGMVVLSAGGVLILPAEVLHQVGLEEGERIVYTPSSRSSVPEGDGSINACRLVVIQDDRSAGVIDSRVTSFHS